METQARQAFEEAKKVETRDEKRRVLEERAESWGHFAGRPEAAVEFRFADGSLAIQFPEGRVCYVTSEPSPYA